MVAWLGIGLHRPNIGIEERNSGSAKTTESLVFSAVFCIIRPDMAQAALEHLVGELTLADLAARSGRSVSEIVEYAMRSKPGAAAARTAAQAGKAAPAPSKAGRARKVDTRTAGGREAYQEAVLGVLVASGKPTAAAFIRRKAGGTPLQARAALNRLIEGGKVTFSGKARATRYTLA